MYFTKHSSSSHKIFSNAAALCIEMEEIYKAAKSAIAKAEDYDNNLKKFNIAHNTKLWQMMKFKAHTKNALEYIPDLDSILVNNSQGQSPTTKVDFRIGESARIVEPMGNNASNVDISSDNAKSIIQESELLLKT